ncbi:MAG: YceD family protein [Christensenellaceae bacterium]|jgi:uncharacterized protein
MMDIDLEKAIREPGKTFSFAYCGRPEYEGICFLEDVALQAEYAVLDGSVSVKGHFNTKVQLACTRCAKDTPYRIDADFDELFQKTDGEEDESEEGIYLYRKKTLRLDKMVYDGIILNIPSQVLCSNSCKGLCQICGIDLNEEMCNCKNQDDAENPFAQLKDLFKQ